MVGAAGALYPIWWPRGHFFLPPVTPPDSGPKSKFKGGVPYWFRPFRVTLPTSHARGRASPTKLRTTFNGTPPNLIGVLGGGDLWQKNSPRGHQMG
jgi:hypothetical protein